MSTPLPRAEFAVTQRFVYLNHASAGVLPHSSIAAIDVLTREHAEAGMLGTFPYVSRMPEYREKIGRFVGGNGTQIALLANTSVAANTIALGIDWIPGDEVLLCDNEFPANAVPWMALRRRGVEVREISTKRERLTPDVLRREISPRTRLVTVSWVSYADGFRHDLGGLAEVAHAAGALFCVDAIQGLGVFEINASDTGIDALYAGAAKWMLGLHGVAILYLAPTLCDRLNLAMPGWCSVQDMWDFHNYDQPFSHDAMRFECGTPNLIGAISIVSAIDFFGRAGQRAISSHVLALTDRLCEGLQRLGATLSTLRGEGRSSGIVTFALADRDSMEVGRMLEQEGIIVTSRGSGLRVSPHGYNTPAEIDVLLEALANIAHVKALV